MSRIIIIAAIVLSAVAADAGEVVRRQVVRGPLGRRRQVVVDRQQVVLPRQSAILLPHSQQLIVPHHFGGQQLIIVR